jgi:two-component system, NtrC family, sensor kinase
VSLARRIFLSFLGIISFSALASTATGALLVWRAVSAEAEARVQGDLKSAREYFRSVLRQLSAAAELTASGLWGKTHAVPAPDLLVLLDPADAQALEAAGGGSGAGFILLPVRWVRGHLGAAAPPPRTLFPKGRALVLFSTARGAAGQAFAGMLLNGAEAAVNEVQELLYGSALYGPKPLGTVTIFQGDTRVATTVLGPGGKVAVGTLVSQAVRRRVLEEGRAWLAPAYVVDDWYISAYEPIRDPRGAVIGILYVGVRERRYADVRLAAIGVLAAVNLPALALLLAAAYLLARGISRPIRRLAEEAGRLAAGDAAAPPDRASGIMELEELSRDFSVMARTVREREAELTRQNAALADATRAYQELLSFVTHELNNSIGSLLLNSTTLADGTLGTLEPDQQDAAEQVLRDMERLRDMVRNYLNLSRLERGTLSLSPAPLDLRAQVITPVLARLGSWVAHSGLELRWDWHQTRPVMGDRELLDIALGNLVVNALKYGKSWILLSCREQDGGLVVSVSNGGPPVSPEAVPRLFRKFTRLSSPGEGAGLGLFLVREIAERHGGRAWCEGGTATTFSLWLPLGGAPPADPQGGPPSAP